MLVEAPCAFEPFDEGDALAEETHEAAFETFLSSALGGFIFSWCEPEAEEVIRTGAGR